MTPDAAADEGALGSPCGRVVRAAGAEVRGAVDRQGDQPSVGHRRRGRRQPVGREALLEPRAKPGRDHVGRQRAGRRQQRRAVGRALPGDHRPVGQRVQRLDHAALEQPRLVLDDHHLGEASGEVADGRGVERPRHAQVQQPHAGVAQVVVGAQAEEPQRLAGLAGRAAARDHADPVARSAHGDPVEAVLDAVPQRDLEPHLVELPLHVEGVRREQSAGGRRPVGHASVGSVHLHHRQHRHDPVGVQFHGARAVGHRLDHLDRAPQTRCPRHRDRVAAEVERLLHVGGEQRRQPQVDQRGVARRRQRRTLRARVLADERDRTAEVGGAGEQRVTQRVAGSVETRGLAVPDADHAVVPGRVEGDAQLRAHHGGGGEFLVERRPMDEVMAGRGGEGRHRVGVAVVPRERAARIPGHERRGPQAGGAVDPQLFEREPREGLGAAHEHDAVVAEVAVVEAVRVHGVCRGACHRGIRIMEDHGVSLPEPVGAVERACPAPSSAWRPGRYHRRS